MNNYEFLEVIKKSFQAYLDVGTSRSTAKLKKLHGAIANDVKINLGNEYSIQAQGYEDGIEAQVEGRYYPKKVDITINYKNKPVAGYAVKFVVRNYSQNSNNYFENMLGETANLRANSIPYFQIFIVFDKVPYFKKTGGFSRYNKINQHDIEKYIKLSEDNPDVYFHTPDKTLIVVVKLKEKALDYQYRDEKEYISYYKSVGEDKNLMSYSTNIKDSFGNSVILNNYEDFIVRTCCMIKGKQKS